MLSKRLCTTKTQTLPITTEHTIVVEYTLKSMHQVKPHTHINAHTIDMRKQYQRQKLSVKRGEGWG